MSNKYKNVLKKGRKKQRIRRIYISTKFLNELGFLAKNLDKDENRLNENDKSIIELLDKLKQDEIIEDYDWGINSVNILEIYIYPIMEGNKPMILYDCLQRIGARGYLKKDSFFT